MTVIRPNSISGITSITAQANEINVFRSNGLIAGLNLNGVNFNTTAGISTLAALKVTGNVDVAGVLTYQDVTNVDSLGIGTFRTGINVSGGQLDVGSNIKLGNAGVVTATSFVGSGANLTSLPSQLTLSNNADNRVITGGSGTNLVGEANLTFTGKSLTTQTTSYPETTELTTEFKAGVANGNRYLNRYIKLTNTYTGSAHGGIPIVWEANADGSNNKSYGSIGMFSDGAITFYSRGAGAAVNVGSSLGMTEKLRIGNDGILVTYGTGAVNAEFNTSNSSGAYFKFDLSASGATTGYMGAGSQLVTGSATADFGIRSQANMVFSTGGSTERLRIDSTGRLLLGSGAIGGTKITGPGGLDVSQYGLSICMGGSSGSSGQARANATTKEARLVIPHYTNAEEPLTAIAGFSASSFNYLNYGGGTSLGNVATRHQFYTAANTTTTGGNEKLKIEHSGVRSFATFVDTSYHANPDPFGDGSGIVYYRLNDNFHDSGVFAKHGTSSQGGDPTFAFQNSSGERCWNNPTDGAISIPNLKNSYPFTMAAWVNISSWPTSSNNDVIMNLSIGGQRVTLCIVKWNDRTTSDPSIMYGGANHHVFPASSRPTNEWIHLVYSVVASNNTSHAVYQNGSVLSDINKGPTHGGTAGWAIGGNASDAERFAMGRIGSIRFFNKAISSSEANTLYQNDTFYT